MVAVDTAHESPGKADHAQVHHHEQQDERDRDEEELVEVAPRQRARHGRRLQVPHHNTGSTPPTTSLFESGILSSVKNELIDT